MHLPLCACTCGVRPELLPVLAQAGQPPVVPPCSSRLLPHNLWWRDYLKVLLCRGPPALPASLSWLLPVASGSLAGAKANMQSSK